MSHHRNLLRKARALLRSGQTPARPPERIWGAPSSGAERCLVCGEAVPADQVVWEAEFVGASGTSNHFFHVFCYRVLQSQWQAEEGAA